MATGGTVVTNLVANTSGYTKGMKKAQQSTKATQGTLAKFKKFGKIAGAGIAVVGAAVVAATVAITKLMTKFAKLGDQFDKMSKRTGVSVEALSELKFAAEQSGASIETVERGIKGMQRQLLALETATPSSSIANAFSKMELSIEDLQGLKPEEQFFLIASRIAAITDHSTKAGAAMAAFGKAGTDLLPMFDSGEAGIAALRDRAIELGAAFTTGDAARAAELTDNMNELKTALAGLGKTFAADIAPFITSSVKSMTEQFLLWRGIAEQLGLIGRRAGTFDPAISGLQPSHVAQTTFQERQQAQAEAERQAAEQDTRRRQILQDARDRIRSRIQRARELGFSDDRALRNRVGGGSTTVGQLREQLLEIARELGERGTGDPKAIENALKENRPLVERQTEATESMNEKLDELIVRDISN